MYQLIKGFKLLILSIFMLCLFNTASFAQSCHFGGTWNTNFGQMTLSQNGRSVSGSIGGKK